MLSVLPGIFAMVGIYIASLRFLEMGSMPGIEKKIGSLFLLELLIIVVAIFCGVMGLRTSSRAKAIVGLILTTFCFIIWCQVLNRMGFARVFERIW